MDEILDEDDFDLDGICPPGVPQVPALYEHTETRLVLRLRCCYCDQVHTLYTPLNGYGLNGSSCDRGPYWLREPLPGEIVDLTSDRPVKRKIYDSVGNPGGFSPDMLKRIAARERDEMVDAYKAWREFGDGPEPADAADAIQEIKFRDYLLRCQMGFGSEAAWESVFGDPPETHDPETPEEQAQFDEMWDKMAAAMKTEMELDKLLSIQAWVERDIPPVDRLLGDLLTTTSRTFLVGRTGTGKTMLGLQIAVHVAAGVDLLHWRAHRPARVLYIDGEMPGELIKTRSRDALRRLGVDKMPGMLWILGRDSEEELAKNFKGLGPIPPLNTVEGHQYVGRLVDRFLFDLVIFDNVMSLVTGDVKEEVTWSGCLPLVQYLTNHKVGQLWFDHTGHDATRQYGTSTKSWRFDSVGIMTPFDGGSGDELIFTLSFDHPGKSRRRTPENWRDFQDVEVSLIDDAWTYNPISVKAKKPSQTESDRTKPKIGKDATILFNAINESRSDWRPLPDGGYEALMNQLSADEAVVFVDAAHPTHAVRPVGCWAPKELLVAVEQSSGRDRLNIHGAIDLETGQTIMKDVLTVDALSTIMLLMAVEAMYPGMRWIHVYLDNARYHHAKLVQAWLARPECRIKLHFIPACCPHLRHTTHNKCYGSFKDFSIAMLNFLRDDVPGNWRTYCDEVTDNFRVIDPKKFRIIV